MKSKAARIILSVPLSIVVFALVLVAEALIAERIFGTTMGADGDERVNGGMAITVALFTIASAVTILFAVRFYKFLARYKIAKVQE